MDLLWGIYDVAQHLSSWVTFIGSWASDSLLESEFHDGVVVSILVMVDHSSHSCMQTWNKKEKHLTDSHL